MKGTLAVTLCLLSCVLFVGCSKHNSAREIFEQGRQKYDEQNWNGAVADFTRVLTLETNFAVYANRALAEAELNRLDDAILDCNRAIELEPTNSALYVDCADLEGKRNNLDAGIANCSKAIKLNPGYAEAYNERGWVEFLQHNYEAAIADATRSLNLGSTNGHAYGTRGWARYGKGDFMGASEDCKKGIALSKPNSSEAQMDQGMLDFINGDYEKSIAAWEKAILQAPSLKQELHPFIENAQLKLQGKNQ